MAIQDTGYLFYVRVKSRLNSFVIIALTQSYCYSYSLMNKSKFKFLKHLPAAKRTSQLQCDNIAS